MTNSATENQASVLKSLAIGALIEAVASAPAVFSPWGHAGPESTPGWFSVMFNLPGLFFAGLLPGLDSDESTPVLFAMVCAVQSLMLGAAVFALARWRNQKTLAHRAR